MKIIIVFTLCFLIILAAILVLPLHPLFENIPEKYYYSSQSNYLKYKNSNNFTLLGLTNSNSKIGSQSFGIRLIKKQNGSYSITEPFDLTEVTSPINKNISFHELINFGNKTYGIDANTGMIFEMHQKTNVDGHLYYNTLIPRQILPANETDEELPMNIRLGFVKDSVMHVIAKNYIIAALDNEFRVRWSDWNEVFKKATSSLKCSSIEFGSVLYSRENYTFSFIPFDCCVNGATSGFGCNQIVVTDVEYNELYKITIPLTPSQRVEAAKFVPYHENEIILLISDQNQPDSSQLMIYSLNKKILLPLTKINVSAAVSVFEII
ncbi:hypothetical protein EDI_156970 [Entamoeba dispar SAW760]|uniref:Apyrase n=1 Tax=Entamoeba dispar (strain ATCC PRA-260 / SAW760) TaxID=370354 RepID=B0EIT4_ENTDS|nr:uncharacterized protein EDI_156970 [Entamoeba dispar SAW760]EDR25582.1 hypothetical protein EDI_156970 [Entamoeba dispar SAW760]|eukprot:EDR25582.1 hypothetical protein EDI_156970 [Entamoeba dispar SAW760]